MRASVPRRARSMASAARPILSRAAIMERAARIGRRRTHLFRGGLSGALLVHVHETRLAAGCGCAKTGHAKECGWPVDKPFT